MTNCRRVGAFHSGLGNGHTPTHRPWPGLAPFIADDRLWHHDLLYADGAPYDEREIASSAP